MCIEYLILPSPFHSTENSLKLISVNTAGVVPLRNQNSKIYLFYQSTIMLEPRLKKVFS